MCKNHTGKESEPDDFEQFNDINITSQNLQYNFPFILIVGCNN